MSFGIIPPLDLLAPLPPLLPELENQQDQHLHDDQQASPKSVQSAISNTILWERSIDMVLPQRKLLTWRGMAISAAMNARIPLYALFVATAVEERPVLVSTI